MASTIKDVARLAGVGVGTASRVISGKGPVAPETAARVQQAIETLGFRPSSIARALSRKSLDMLGVYVPQYQGLFHGAVLETIGRELREVEPHMVTASGGACGDARLQALDGIDFLRQRECDGLLLMSHALHDDDLRQLHAQMPQIAVLNRIVPGLESVCFSSDHALGGRLAARGPIAPIRPAGSKPLGTASISPSASSASSASAGAFMPAITSRSWASVRWPSTISRTVRSSGDSRRPRSRISSRPASVLR